MPGKKPQPLELESPSDDSTEEYADDDDDENDDRGVRHAQLDARAMLRLLNQARRLLYLSRFVYYASELVWVFGSSIWLAALTNYSNLFWISLYQATATILVMMVVPWLSHRIDDGHQQNNKTSANRSKLVTGWIVGQHACVMATIVLMAMTLGLQETKAEDAAERDWEPGLDRWRIFFMVSICLVGGLAQCLHNVLEVAVERDWTVVLAEEAERAEESLSPKGNHEDGDDSNTNAWLKHTNVALKQIYLGCQIFGPVGVGALLALTGGDDRRILWIVFGMKGASMVAVVGTMRRLYWWVPALHQHQTSTPAVAVVATAPHEEADDAHARMDDEYGGHNDDDADDDSSEGDDFRDGFAPSEPTSTGTKCCSDLQLFFAQPVVGSGVALALLYANILTFGPTMVAFLLEQGNLSKAWIGTWKGVSHGTAFLGTVWFSRSTSSVESKATNSLIWMVASLTVTMVGAALAGTSSGETTDETDDDETSTVSRATIGSALIIGGVLLSRCGLWGYDLGVIQIYQTSVDAKHRGTVGGTQTLLNNALGFFPLVLGMLFNKVEDFWILMVVGYSCVVAALLSHVGWKGSNHHSSGRDAIRYAPV